MLEEKLVEVLELVKSGVSWTVQETPGVIKELMVWKTWDYSIGIVVSLIVCFILFRLYISAKKRIEDSYHDWTDEWPTFSALIIFGLWMLISLLMNCYYLIELLIAPRIWLFEYVTENLL